MGKNSGGRQGEKERGKGEKSILPERVEGAGKMSKSAKRREKKKRMKQDGESGLKAAVVTEEANRHGKSVDMASVAGKSPAVSKLSLMQQQYAKKLEGARFRIINERLYTCKGHEALKEFSKDPSLFDTYHEGFREQASSWPQNPLDLVVRLIEQKYPKAVVADMGCGDAVLSKRLKNKVHSFDLVSRDPCVVACDMARVPLPDRSVNVVVFCLALMGENIADFVKEAHRILMDGGIMWIAEVKSRFDGPDVDVKKFIAFLNAAGFDKVSKDTQGNKMFFTLTLRKSRDRMPVNTGTFTAKPCIYKRR